MSTRTIGLIVILIIVTGILLIVASNQKPTPPKTAPVPIKVVPTIAPKTILNFSPSPLEMSSPSASVDVNIDTQGQNATAVELELSYDPKVLSNITITPGNFFYNPIVLIKKIDEQEGTIIYAVGISPAGDPKKGIGKIATISFATQMAAGQKTEIKMLPRTMVTANGVAASVLKQAENLTIIYGNSPITR